ncbi:MAG TPA: hypothetical protein VKA91_07360 [Nitrososphaeraceae archaeon]|nr:hypothetical protein [Nitrososphaeraceae archaeon]
MTNNAISNAASSNQTLSLPQSSSSTFPNLSNQRDMDRMDDSESFCQNKGYIAD